VASEVRALAGRSARSAGEIKSLIQSSTEQVSTGNGIAREAGTAISATCRIGARQVQQLLTEIDTGTREQSQGMRSSAARCRSSTARPSRTRRWSKQTAAAAAALRDQAMALAERVARFRLPESAAAAA
jgi:methyl-accepting chemotaxis protein